MVFCRLDDVLGDLEIKVDGVDVVLMIQGGEQAGEMADGGLGNLNEIGDVTRGIASGGEMVWRGVKMFSILNGSDWDGNDSAGGDVRLRREGGWFAGLGGCGGGGEEGGALKKKEGEDESYYADAEAIGVRGGMLGLGL